MGDTTVIKVDSNHSPKGLDGQIYLATGKHIAMRMWRAYAAMHLWNSLNHVRTETSIDA